MLNTTCDSLAINYRSTGWTSTTIDFRRLRTIVQHRFCDKTLAHVKLHYTVAPRRTLRTRNSKHLL